MKEITKSKTMPCNIMNFFRAANGEYTHWGKFEKEV